MALQATRAQTADSLIVGQLREEGVTFSKDNAVTLLMNGQEKFDDLFKAIRQARSSVHLEYFNFRNDSIANLLFDLLAERAAAGVRCSTALATIPTTSRSSAGISTASVQEALKSMNLTPCGFRGSTMCFIVTTAKL